MVACAAAVRVGWRTYGIGDLGLNAEGARALQAGGHGDLTVGHEAPVADAEAIEADLFADSGQVDDFADRLVPGQPRQVAEGELHFRVRVVAVANRRTPSCVLLIRPLTTTAVRPIIAGLVTRFCVRVHHAGFGFPVLRRLAQAAERLGFDGLSLYDVLNPRALEVWTALSGLTVATRRLVLLPLVLDVGYRHPATLAKMTASLDVLGGGGRLIVGLGYGGNPTDHAAYGYGWDFCRRSIAWRSWRSRRAFCGACGPRPGSVSTGAGSNWSMHTGFPTATPGGPPLLIASRGVRHGLGGVARQADLCNVSFDLSPA